jgi:glycogen debranching enzyme
MGHRTNNKKPSLKIPKSDLQGSANASPVTPVTPKTPADEAIEFFQSDHNIDKPIQVYELRLDVDGGPRKEISYIRLPPAYEPYVLRVSLAAGTPASKNGVFKTNFPLDGGPFVRDRYTERKYV